MEIVWIVAGLGIVNTAMEMDDMLNFDMPTDDDEYIPHLFEGLATFIEGNRSLVEEYPEGCQISKNAQCLAKHLIPTLKRLMEKDH